MQSFDEYGVDTVCITRYTRITFPCPVPRFLVVRIIPAITPESKSCILGYRRQTPFLTGRDKGGAGGERVFDCADCLPSAGCAPAVRFAECFGGADVRHPACGHFLDYSLAVNSAAVR